MHVLGWGLWWLATVRIVVVHITIIVIDIGEKLPCLVIIVLFLIIIIVVITLLIEQVSDEV